MENKGYIFALLAALGGIGFFLYTELNKVASIEGRRGGVEVWQDRWLQERDKRTGDRDAFVDRYLGLWEKRAELTESRLERLENLCHGKCM